MSKLRKKTKNLYDKQLLEKNTLFLNQKISIF